MTYHIGHQFWMNIIAEDVPPQVQIVGQMFVFLRWIWLLSNWIEIDNPWFQLSDEVKNLNIVTESIQIEKKNSIRV